MRRVARRFVWWRSVWRAGRRSCRGQPCRRRAAAVVRRDCPPRAPPAPTQSSTRASPPGQAGADAPHHPPRRLRSRPRCGARQRLPPNEACPADRCHPSARQTSPGLRARHPIVRPAAAMVLPVRPPALPGRGPSGGANRGPNLGPCRQPVRQSQDRLQPRRSDWPPPGPSPPASPLLRPATEGRAECRQLTVQSAGVQRAQARLAQARLAQGPARPHVPKRFRPRVRPQAEPRQPAGFRPARPQPVRRIPAVPPLA